MPSPLHIRKLVFEPTTFCNAHCPHCPRFDEDGFVHSSMDMQHLPLNIVQGITKKTMPHLSRVQFQGDKGDPCMHPQISEMIQHFEFTDAVLMSTNGSIHSTKWWTALASIKNLIVTFSIDGLEDTNHLYRVNLQFNKIMSNAQAFIDAGGCAVWKCLIWKHNQHQINEIKERARGMGFHRVVFKEPDVNRFQGLTSWPVKRNGVHLHNISPPDYSAQELMAFNEVFNTNRDSRLEIIPEVVEKQNQKTCPWQKNATAYVNYKGYVLPCCSSHFDIDLDYEGTHSLERAVDGFDNISLKKYNIKEIVDGDFYSSKLETLLQNKDTALYQCKKTCGFLFDES